MLNLKKTALLLLILIGPFQASALEAPLFHDCTHATYTGSDQKEGFDHSTSKIASSFSPHHSAPDILTVRNNDVEVKAKFTYGPLGKDLENEWVEAYLDDCSGTYIPIGRLRTDNDGRVSILIRKGRLSYIGAYRIVFRVVGDNTTTSSTLRVYPKGTQLAVFDIDGTLTTDDSELTQQIVERLLDSDYTPRDRAGAVDTVAQRANKEGYVIVYLTGRHYVLTNLTREWLNEKGFSAGVLNIAQSIHDILPKNSGVGQFKADYLKSLQDMGFEIGPVYGNATTDIFAYEQVGCPKDKTFIAGEHGGEGNTVALGSDFVGHLQAIQ